MAAQPLRAQDQQPVPGHITLKNPRCHAVRNKILVAQPRHSCVGRNLPVKTDMDTEIHVNKLTVVAAHEIWT